MTGQTNDQLDNEESGSPQKNRIAPPKKVADEMTAVDAKQPMLSHEKQTINHFEMTTDEIMVIIISLI